MQDRVGHMDIYILDQISYMLNSMLNNINSYYLLCGRNQRQVFVIFIIYSKYMLQSKLSKQILTGSPCFALLFFGTFLVRCSRSKNNLCNSIFAHLNKKKWNYTVCNPYVIFRSTYKTSNER